MWSWSQPSRTGSVSSSRTSSYPATRRTTAHSASTATPAGGIHSSSTQSIPTRTQHIESYIQNPRLQQSTRKVPSDSTNSTFDTVFLTKDRATLCLRVQVPQSTTSHHRSHSSVLRHSQDVCPAPIMTLVGVKARHPWIDEDTMRVSGNTYHPIRDDSNWIKSNLMLGQAVCSVVEHLQLNPPLVLEFTDRDLAAQNGTFVGKKVNEHRNGDSKSSDDLSSNPPSYNAAISDMQPNSRVKYPTTDDYHDPFPRAPQEFPELENMNREEMQKLLNDENAFLEFVNSSFMTPIEIFVKIEENSLATAEKTLSHKEELMRLSADVIEMRGHLREKLEVYEPLHQRYTKLCMPPSLKGVLKKLNSARREASSSSDKIADSFSAGKLDVNSYIEQYMETRKLFHERSAKMERLQNIET